VAKITELPAATGTVTMEDIVPIVDDPDGATPTTKKVTVREVMEAANGIVATLTGSKFSGPVTASSRMAIGTTYIPSGQNVHLFELLEYLLLPSYLSDGDRTKLIKYARQRYALTLT
jgi:hypothetical protein